jgi:hypothetical protein
VAAVGNRLCFYSSRILNTTSDDRSNPDQRHLIDLKPVRAD